MDFYILANLFWLQRLQITIVMARFDLEIFGKKPILIYITFRSEIDQYINFFFLSYRLIEPSPTYPMIEIEIVLNFFPGDHFTAEKYKAFVNHMTKTHSGKDQRITIDDYFHVEDHREWTFFIGNESYIAPWWDKDAAKIPLSCIFLLGWPFRMAYGGRIAKHQVGIF